MDRTSALELLNATHDFPCPFTFKVIGASGRGFASRVVAIVRDVMLGDSDPPHRLRHTPGGRHVAVTLEPTVESAEQVLLVYERIKTIEGVVMTM